MLQFQYFPYLLALLAIPFMIFLYLMVVRWKKKTIKKIGDEQLVKQLIGNYSPRKYFTKFILLLLAFSMAAMGWAGLRKPQGAANVKHSGIDVMIALDVSKSMLAQDVQPSRLERAKQLISKIIDKLGDDRVGIVLFAGKAYLQMPLTTDHAAAKMYLSSATPDVVPTQGTVIGDALKMCFNAFNSKEKKYKSIILISDGEDHDEAAAKVTTALAQEGVMINTVGIGSAEGSKIIDPATGETKIDATGAAVITRLNETILKNVAADGNGLYQLFTTANEVAENLNKQLKSMEQRTISENASTTYRYYFQWLIAASLLLLLSEFFISEKRGKRAEPIFFKNGNPSPVSSFSKTLTIVLFLMISAAELFAQKENAFIKKGNTAFNDKQLDVAIDNYKKAIAINPKNEKASFNLGNALYKNGKAADAMEAYGASIKNSFASIDQSKAWYNTGVVLQNNNKLPECIDAYKKALKQNPADEDARLNLQKAIQKQQQEQKQKNDPDKKKDKPQQKKPDKEKDKQPQPQQSKMTKKEAEEKLKALMQQEKNLQDKLRKVDAASPNKPEKDW